MTIDRAGSPAADAATTPVRSELPAVVLDVGVSPGTVVAEGQELCLIESMKMEIPVLAPVSGVITEVRVATGQSLAKDDLIVQIAP